MTWPGKLAVEALRQLWRKPATQLYPFTPAQIPERFRGQIVFTPDQCVGCNLCQMDCPSGALTIHEVGPKRYEAALDVDRCLFCAQCVDSCNKHSLVATQRFELAALRRSDLHLLFPAKADDAPA